MNTEAKPVSGDDADGLLFACVLDGKGGARPVGWSEIDKLSAEGAEIWIHLDRSSDRAREWLTTTSGLTPATVNSLLAEESRPRVFRGKRGYITILRGINQNEGAEEEDLVALRLWCDGNRLITIRHRRLFVPRSIYQELTETGTGPTSVPELYCQLVERLVRQIADVVARREDRLDTLELSVEKEEGRTTSRALSELRHEVIELRRYIAPQREALSQVLAEPPDWLPAEVKPIIRDAADRQQRHLEELDALRDRSIVIKDDVINRLNEQMNRNMYVISMVAAIFLPLSFLTGLLGINVGGMPGIEYEAAFWLTCAALAVLLILELWLFKKLKWI